MTLNRYTSEYLTARHAAFVDEKDLDQDDQQQDAIDFRPIIRNNIESINRNLIRSLGDQVWEGDAAELLDFIKIALEDRPSSIGSRCHQLRQYTLEF